MNCFDSHGWLTSTEIPGRVGSDEVPGHGSERIVGQPWPNWTGFSWGLLDYVEPVIPAPPINPADWYVTVGAFFNRFGALKIPILASADLVIQALIKDSMVRARIDLKNPEVAQGIDIIIGKGFAIDKDAIINTLPTDSELFKG